MKRLLLVWLYIALPLASLAEPTFETAFSPHGGATELVRKVIGEAHQNIRLVGYGFSSKPVAEALLEAHKRGVDVRVVLDRSNETAPYSDAAFLVNLGIPVRMDYQHPITHDKYIVIDDQIVETGSLNFTRQSEINAENVSIRGAPQLAITYLANWATLWDESVPLTPRY